MTLHRFYLDAWLYGQRECPAGFSLWRKDWQTWVCMSIE
jgi:hypothetical protein